MSQNIGTNRCRIVLPEEREPRFGDGDARAAQQQAFNLTEALRKHVRHTS